MSMMLMRPITSGSRQAPDPYDQYLESRCMYRKHTARDASCLFRVIAEQMYDTQMLHYEVRLECVRYMTRKRRIFEQQVHGDFDSYMLDMAKPKTYGTMLELRALCCMYRRNVILFEPFNLGTSVTYNNHFQDNFRVFYTNEYHFDSVYTLDYIESAAICQSISFKLLYKMLFKLPDVSFAIETMLHPQTFEWGNYEMVMNPNGYIDRVVCPDGRLFLLDLPENTKCILENFKLCNFHSKALRASESPPNGRIQLDMMPNEHSDLLHMCPNRLNSCVRQLLDDGITPFPYKVAKSMDPNMYRNIEFDSWSDMRKESKRYNIYVNDYNFKVGAKCRVELMSGNERHMYTCHVQKIAVDKTCCLVFIEQFGKKYLVPYDTLHPMPPDEFRPWSMPFRYQRQTQRSHFAKITNSPKLPKWKKAKVYEMDNFFDNGQFLPCLQLDSCYGCPPPLLNEHPAAYQHVTSGLDHHSREQRYHLHEKQPYFPQSHQQNQQHRLRQQQRQQSTAVALAGAVHAQAPPPTVLPANQFVNYIPIAGRPGQIPLPAQMPPPWPSSPMPGEGCMFMHFGGYAPQPPPPPPISRQAPPQQPPPPPFAAAPYLYAQPAPIPSNMLMPPLVAPSNCNTNSNGSGSSSSLNSCATSHNVNPGSTVAIRSNNDDQTEPRRSLHLNGEDLPANRNTLRYFYNMGVDTWNMRGNQMPTPIEMPLNQSQYNLEQELKRPKQQIAAPPNSPDTVPKTVNNSSSCVAAITEPDNDNSRSHSNNRGNVNGNCNGNNNGGYNKSRAKPPELHDLNKDIQLSQAMLLPTPNPSPNTSNNQFNFYPNQAPMTAQQPLSIYYTPPKDGQVPYNWNIATPPSTANMIEVPFEMFNNMKMDANGVNNMSASAPTAVYSGTTTTAAAARQ